MHEIDRIQLLADLAGEHCELNHGPNTNRADYVATDYIVLPFGYKENQVKTTTARELVIPVCYECAQALLQNEWTLLYCFECTHSRWVCRQLAKNSYRHHILWLRGCPDCTNELGGLYFNDERKTVDAVEFVSNQFNIRAA